MLEFPNVSKNLLSRNFKINFLKDDFADTSNRFIGATHQNLLKSYKLSSIDISTLLFNQSNKLNKCLSPLKTTETLGCFPSESFSSKKTIKKTSETKRIFWVGCFPHNNHSIGDHAQTLAVQKYLSKNFSDYEILRFCRDSMESFFKEDISGQDLIFIHSSGDFGDLYPDWHKLRKRIVASYPHVRVVQLPVSVYYRNPASLEIDKVFFSDKTNFLLLCRSKADADFLSGNFGCQVRFHPDFAFYLTPPVNTASRKGNLLIIRSDEESLLKKSFPSKIMRRYVRKPLNMLLNLDFKKRVRKYAELYDALIMDTQISSVDINDSNREQIVYKAMQFIQKYELVITDRFHACVFAYLTDTPFKTIQGVIEQKTTVDPAINYKDYFAGFRKLVFEKPKQRLKNASVSGNDTLQLIKTRRSIRKWVSKAVRDDLINSVLEAGKYAPSACASQAARFKVVKDSKSIQFICENTSLWFHNNPPSLVILIVYDLSRMEQCSLDVKSWHNRFIWQDTACATMNMLLAAESLGLKTCWVSFDPEQQKRLNKFFNFKNSVLTNGIFLGYSDQKVDVNKAWHQGRPIKRQT